ncbi:MAG: Flp pilus assembly complex ATPase component TadA, partial [Methylococcales bacterium]|nr:Flp pilus assembly complex ATPase component TadA [Methylococcales bacterium]
FYEALLAKHKPDNIQLAADFSCYFQERRFRGHIFHHINGWTVNLRALADEIPTLAQLGFSEETVVSLARNTGLVLYCGACGAGKSTSLAATAEQLAIEGVRGVLVTIENPIEYLFKDESCFQRAVGIDIESAAEGVIQAMRQRVQTIIIGEIRDPATAEAAILAGLSGHRVMATMHAESIEEVVSRMWGFLNPQYHDLLRFAIQGIMVQHLIRHPGSKPVAVYETLQFDHPTRSVLTQGAKAVQRLSHECFRQGRNTLKEHAKTLLRQGKLNEDAAELWFSLKGLGDDADSITVKNFDAPPEAISSNKKVEVEPKKQSTGGIEERKHPRFLRKQVTVSIARKNMFGKPGKYGECSLVNVSRGGICVVSNKSLSNNDVVSVLIIRKENTMQLHGKIRRIHNDRQHIQFLDLSENEEEQLAVLCDLITGENLR